jgi:hypothetical protein
MASQNLVSATISPEAKAEVLGKLADIRKRLDFLKPLDRSEIHALVKVGNGFSPFLEKAHRAVNDHPEIMPRLFDLAEFNNDYSLFRDLADIGEVLKALSEGVQNTLLAAGSDSMIGALEIYAAIKSGSDKVPGLKVAGSEMSEFFKRAKAKGAQTSRA